MEQYNIIYMVMLQNSNINLTEIEVLNYDINQHYEYSGGIIATIPYDTYKYNFSNSTIDLFVPADPNPLYSDQPISTSSYNSNIRQGPGKLFRSKIYS